MRSWFRASGGCNGWVCVCGGWGGVRLVLFLTCGCGESCLGVLCRDVSLDHGGYGIGWVLSLD